MNVSDVDLIAEAWNAIEILRSCIPLQWKIRDIKAANKIQNGLAKLHPVPDADGGRVADITISKARLGKNWRESVQTRIAHEWMELALMDIRLQAESIYCPSVINTLDALSERASEVMESMMKLILSLRKA